MLTQLQEQEFPSRETEEVPWGLQPADSIVHAGRVVVVVVVVLEGEDVVKVVEEV